LEADKKEGCIQVTDSKIRSFSIKLLAVIIIISKDEEEQDAYDDDHHHIALHIGGAT
jgi:hypothetical protein